MTGWHHQLDGHEFEQAPGAGDGQGKPGVLQSMGLETAGHEWATELNWYYTDVCHFCQTIYTWYYMLNLLPIQLLIGMK